MENILNAINRDEVLRYLGYRGGEIPVGVLASVDGAREEMLKTARPKYAYAIFDLDKENGLMLKGTRVFLPGEDMKRLLAECEKCILVAATLGSETEFLLRRTQVTDMQQAVLLDSCGSVAIENVCDHLERGFRSEWLEKGRYLTDRFSPGYGDMPVIWQRELCNLLDTNRKMGLYAGASGMLIPQKSVTAIIGISANKQPRCRRACEECGLFDTCTFRKEGRVCDK